MNQPSIVTNPAITSDLNITKDDIVAIRVADIEQQILARRVQLEHTRAQLIRDIAQTHKDEERTSQDIARTVIAGALDSVVAALRTLFPDTRPVVYTLVSPTVDEPSVRACGAHPLIARGFYRLVTAEQSQPIVALRQRREDLEKQVAAAELDMMEVKRQLSSIPALERQVKAAVARAVINDRDGRGGELLAVINQVQMPGVLAITSAPGV